MNMMKIDPFIIPAPWVLDLTNLTVDETLDGLTDNTGINVASTCMSFEISADADRLMSTFCSIWFIYKNDLAFEPTLLDMVINNPDWRWIELFELRTDVAYECVKLLRLFKSPPRFLDKVSKYIIEDQSTVDLLCTIWIEKNWHLTFDCVYIIRNSCHAWKILDKYRQTMFSTSRILLREMIRRTDHDIDLWSSLMILIGTNPQSLEYLLHLDEEYADGIETTVETINDLQLWKVVFQNSAAGTIIDWIMEFPDMVEDDGIEDGDVGGWIVKMLESSPLIAEYVSIHDMDRFSSRVYDNPFAIDLIMGSVNLDCVYDYIINGVIDIGENGSEETAFKAIYIIEEGINQHGHPIIDDLTQTQWRKLLNGKFTHDYTLLLLEEMGKCELLDDLLRDLELIPYWTEHEDGSIVISNLNWKTVKNMPTKFCDQIKDAPYLLSFLDWPVLFRTRFGVQLGINNISYVIEQDALFELLRSPMITKDEIIELSSSTDLFEFCNDDDYGSLISREDAFTVDLKKVMSTNQPLMQELLKAWHEPSRLFRESETHKLSMFEYMQMM